MAVMQRLLVGTLIIAALILVWILAQGVGEAVGHGLKEWVVQ